MAELSATLERVDIMEDLNKLVIRQRDVVVRCLHHLADWADNHFININIVRLGNSV